jgi:peptidyl-prolyl cis-trans isomerase-like 6
MKTVGSSFVYMDVKVDKTVKKVVFQLYTDLCPITCANFKKLCIGGEGAPSYSNTIFHRVVPGGWVQGGDVEGGRGDGGVSIYGKTFADESFAVKHDAAGVLAMASISNEPHTNNSQFYITLAPQPWLDCKRVAFGRVVSGMAIFKAMEKLESKNQRPVSNCTIVAAGEVVIDA